MVTVQIHQLLMHAYHGVYKEEQKTGSNYEVNLDVKFEEKRSGFEDITDTISYEDLFLIVKKKMQAAASLLENVCEGIIRKIKHEYPNVTEVTISIYKLDPPIENFQGRVGVTLRKKFDD